MSDFAANLAALRQLQTGLTGDRVVVRTWRPEDAAELFAAIDSSREHLQTWMEWVDRHQTIDDTMEFITRSAVDLTQGESVGLGIFDRTDGRTVLGATGMHDIDWSIPAVEIGYWARKTAQGHGYIGEAVNLLTSFVLAEIGANRIAICCDPANVRSRMVAERARYKFEGQLRHRSRTPSGSLRDTLVYSLIPSDRIGGS